MNALVTMLMSLLASLVLVVAGPVCAQSPVKLLPERSEVAFVSKQMGVPVEGRFKRFDAQLSFDPKAPAAGSVAVRIDLSSVDIGAETEGELAKPGWFDSKRTPNATFKSTAIKPAGPNKLDVAGVLTIKGNARATQVPVTLSQAGGVTLATGVFAMKRLDYKIGEGEWDDPSLVADEVQVKFKLAFAGVAPL